MAEQDYDSRFRRLARRARPRIPRRLDAGYTALTETADPGQDPQKGGLLVAHRGKGTYIYVAYALYRQLPELVPGAYRILANLLSAGKDRLCGGSRHVSLIAKLISRIVRWALDRSTSEYPESRT